MEAQRFTSEILKAASKDSKKFQPQHTKELNNELMEKWHAFGLLKGLGNDHHRSAMAQLLENEAQYILKEAPFSTTADAEGYNTSVFPMVRRIFGGLLANDIISVQPMSLPSGLVFYLDLVDDQGLRVMDELLYNNQYGMGSKYWLSYISMEPTNTVDGVSNPRIVLNKGTGTVGTGFAWVTGTPSNPSIAEESGMYQVTTTGFTKDPSTDLHKYSLPEVYILPYTPSNDWSKAVRFYVTTTNCTRAAGPESSNLVTLARDVASGSLALYFYKPSNSIANAQVATYKDYTLATLLAGGVDSYDVGSGLFAKSEGSSKLYTLDGTPADASSTVQFFNYASPVAEDVKLVVNFGFNPFEVGDNVNQPLNTSLLPGEESSNIKQINLEVKSSPIVAETRKLKAKWTPELQQDLQAYHSVDAEAELTGVMSDEVAMEIDREIIRDLIAMAGTEINLDISQAISAGETVGDRYRIAIEAVMAGSNAIHKKTLRGYGNWIIVSPEFATVLQFAGAFLRNDTDKTINFSGGMQLVGLLENRVKVYVDPYMQNNVAIMGYTGNSFLESGYVYAPYVPVMFTPVIHDPNTFVPRKGMMTRYGKKLIRSDFFCRINITGWPTAGLGSALYQGGFGYAERAFNIGRKDPWGPTVLN